MQYHLHGTCTVQGTSQSALQEIDRLLGKKSSFSSGLNKPWVVCPILRQIYHIPKSIAFCGFTTLACIMPCPFSPACQMIWGAFMKPPTNSQQQNHRDFCWKSTHQPHQLINKGTFKARGEVQEAACMRLVLAEWI